MSTKDLKKIVFLLGVLETMTAIEKTRYAMTISNKIEKGSGLSRSEKIKKAYAVLAGVKKIKGAMNEIL